jgi:hypothetical protein
MALFFPGKSKCALCGEVIAVNEPVIATSHFITDKNDSLWRYSDAPFHKRCFVTWERRQDFVRLYNNTMGAHIFGSGKRHHMDDEGFIHLIPVEEG